MGVPLNHPFIDGIFPYKPSSYWGSSMETLIWGNQENGDSSHQDSTKILWTLQRWKSMEKFARKRTWSNGLNLVTHVILIAFFGDPFVDFVSMGYLKPGFCSTATSFAPGRVTSRVFQQGYPAKSWDITLQTDHLTSISPVLTIKHRS